MSVATNPYLKTKILTASPAELRLLLLEGALRFAGSARAGLEQRDFEKSFEGFTRCQAILIELLSALNSDHAPDLCAKLSGLYTFMFNRIVEANSTRSTKITDEVIKLLEYECETWRMTMAKLDSESANSVSDGRVSIPA